MSGVNIGRVALRVIAIINPEIWSYHFTDDPTNVVDAVNNIDSELTPIGVELHAVPPTLDQLGDEEVSAHRYTAHDSGFMAFAVETDMAGVVHAVNSTGKRLASVEAPEGFDSENLKHIRDLTHALVDAVFDAEQDADRVIDLNRTAALTLSAQALSANPDDRDQAREDLQKVLMVMGLVPDPKALGCNMGDNFEFGSRRMKSSVKTSREESS